MSVICFSIRSPDGKQQVVKNDLLHALRFLAKAPDGWYAEEYFDGTISRGIPFVAEPMSRQGIGNAIAELERPRAGAGSDGKAVTLRQLLAELGELSRAYWIARAI